MSESDPDKPKSGSEPEAATDTNTDREVKPEIAVPANAEAGDQPSESASIEQAPGRAETGSAERAKPAGKPGRLLAFFALVVAAGALAGSGYLYFLLVYQEPLAPIVTRFSDVESRSQQLAADLTRLQREQAAAFTEFAAGQRQEMTASSDQLLEAMNALTSQAPPSTRDWKVAEVAYLLRIANHRLLMERDTEGALSLLSAADVILQELDDFVFYQVRANLADEILALKNVTGNDVQGLYLRLEAVKGEIRSLPPAQPRFESEAVESTEALGAWDSLLAQLSTYLRFRKFDGSVKPLLAPDEAVYLELNFRLMLERAQLAALRREQIVYEQSIATASEWVAQYLDPALPQVKQTSAELESLLAVDLNRSLPDVSGSLAALKAIGIVDL